MAGLDSRVFVYSNMPVLVNGSQSKEFNVGRGLRQGDLLLPFLFLIAVEGFSVLVNKVVEVNLFEGYKFGSSKQPSVEVSHIQFANDTLVVCKKDKASIWAIKASLQLFKVMFGLKVNFHKSQLMGVNVSRNWLEEGVMFLNCKVGDVPFFYLRLPIMANPRSLSTWAPVMDKIKEQLSGWRSKSLSFCGRIVLLKSVLTALPSYFLSIFKGPAGIIYKIEYVFKPFLWGRDSEKK